MYLYFLIYKRRENRLVIELSNWLALKEILKLPKNQVSSLYHFQP